MPTLNWSRLLLPLLFLSLSARAQAQMQREAPPVKAESSTAALGSIVEVSPYAVKERGADHRVWSRVTMQTNLMGNVSYQTNSYTELETGMHFLKDGQWHEARQEIEITQTGAQAIHGLHQVVFSGELNTTNAVELTTPDGKLLRSHILGLSYYDSATGQSVLIAELQDAHGELLPSGNQVIYPDAFTDFQADVRYTYTKAGFEQDIILRQQPPAPEKYGLAPETTKLQVLTEFVQAPEPVIKQAELAGGEVDQQLDFGAMKMGHGKAFSLGEEKDSAVPVNKQWLHLEGRTFLMEEVEVPRIQTQLEALPLPQASNTKPATGNFALHRVSTKRLLPALKLAKQSGNPVKLAGLPLKNTGLVLDYTTLNSDTSDYIFQSDTTYYISGNVNLTGDNTLEGGTVIKFNNGSLNINDDSTTLNCKTAPYRPAIFTDKNDNTVGETISGSSGTPSNSNGSVGLNLGDADPADLHDIRMSYLSVGLYIHTTFPALSLGNLISSAQFVNCGTGIRLPLGDCRFRNVLMQGGTYAFSGGNGSTGICENVTFHGNGYLQEPGSATITLRLTNCLTAAVADTNHTILIGGNNQFLPSDNGVFQTVGAAVNYLADNSPYRNAGTTSINADLLTDLRKKTTYPPVVLSGIASLDMTWGPQAQRDTDTPDLGYHYDPLDYALTNYSITNCTLTINAGVAVATANGYALWVKDNCQVVCEGTPTSHNHFVRYFDVQEQPVKWGGNNSDNSLFHVYGFHYGTDPSSTARFRFTDFSACSGVGYLVYDIGQFGFSSLAIRDCSFQGGHSKFGGPSTCTVGLTNNLFERSFCSYYDDATLTACNNLHKNCGLSIEKYGSSTWLINDNAFDSGIISDDGDDESTHDYNAFINAANWLYSSGANEFTLSSFNYAKGPLGDYYQVSTGLVNAGSRTADLAGLYHFTTQTNQVKETNSTVDIGFHYVAVASGVPIDTDGDGLVDYFEDTNGNGSYSSASDLSDWNSADTDGDGVSDYLEYIQGRNPRIANTATDDNWLINLRVFTPLK